MAMVHDTFQINRPFARAMRALLLSRFGEAWCLLRRSFLPEIDNYDDIKVLK